MIGARKLVGWKFRYLSPPDCNNLGQPGDVISMIGHPSTILLQATVRPSVLFGRLGKSVFTVATGVSKFRRQPICPAPPLAYLKMA
jgi:hypothetical protein